MVRQRSITGKGGSEMTQSRLFMLIACAAARHAFSDTYGANGVPASPWEDYALSR